MLNLVLKYINRIIKSNLFKSTLIYTIFNIINVSIPFLLLPILTRYLTPHDYGILSMYATLFSFLSSIAGFCTIYYPFNLWFKQKQNEIKKIIFNVLFLNLIYSFIVLGIFWIFKNLIFSYTQLNFIWLIVLIINVFFETILGMLINIYRMENKIWHFISFNLSRTLLVFF